MPATIPSPLSQQLAQLRADGSEEALQEATALERKFEADHPEDFDLDSEDRKIAEDGSVPEDQEDDQDADDGGPRFASEAAENAYAHLTDAERAEVKGSGADGRITKADVEAVS